MHDILHLVQGGVEINDAPCPRINSVDLTQYRVVSTNAIVAK
jgi:hypothetical protein